MPVHIVKKFFRWTRWTKGKRSFVPSTATPFVALYPFIPVKLPHNIVNIAMPPYQGGGVTSTVAGATRITEQLSIRVTQGGNIRVTRDTTVTARPELTVVKLPSTIITISVPGPKPRVGDGTRPERVWSRR